MTERPRGFGPKGDPPYHQEKCPACQKDFKPGDFTALVALGPGDSEESQKRCRERRPYNAVAIEVHYLCAYGYPHP